MCGCIICVCEVYAKDVGKEKNQESYTHCLMVGVFRPCLNSSVGHTSKGKDTK